MATRGIISYFSSIFSPHRWTLACHNHATIPPRHRHTATRHTTGNTGRPADPQCTSWGLREPSVSYHDIMVVSPSHDPVSAVSTNNKPTWEPVVKDLSLHSDDDPRGSKAPAPFQRLSMHGHQTFPHRSAVLGAPHVWGRGGRWEGSAMVRTPPRRHQVPCVHNRGLSCM